MNRLFNAVLNATAFIPEGSAPEVMEALIEEATFRALFPEQSYTGPAVVKAKDTLSRYRDGYELVAHDEVFVFGSNLAGRHGRGAALHARQHYGAQLGVGVGPTGHAYAIPTKSEDLRTLTIPTIKYYVDEFLGYARMYSHKNFLVTRIGCGLAGYEDKDIAPLFRGAPVNCVLPEEWRSYLYGPVDSCAGASAG